MPLRPLYLILASTAVVAACAAPKVAPDPFEATGETIAFSGGEAGAGAACATCHGTKGQGDGALAPRLAGLDRGYAARQLELYASGARRHPQMEWIARRLGDDARQKVLVYYADLSPPPTPGTAATNCVGAQLYHAGEPARGIVSCASCHGPGGVGDAGNPPLAGQPAPYLARQLEAWASGKRYGDPDGTMTAISRALHPSDQQAVAAYAAGLKGDAGDRPVPEACPRIRRPDQLGGA